MIRTTQEAHLLISELVEDRRKLFEEKLLLGLEQLIGDSISCPVEIE